MVFKNRYDLERKYNHTIKDLALFLFVSLLGFVMIIYCLIEGYRAQAFIANSALVLFLSDRLISIYDYIIIYETDKDATDNLDPGKRFKIDGYINIIIYILMCVAYVVTLIMYRMSFDPSINNTTYELFLTIAISMWTFVLGGSMGKVNSKLDQYIKLIKS